MAPKDMYLAKLEMAERELAMQQKTRRPKIQKVHQSLIVDREVHELHYKPKVVSFGPIHHRLALGESQKFMWAGAYMKKHRPGEDAEQLCQKIAENIKKLKESYTEDVIEGYSDDELAWMFMVDGCAMLYLLISLAGFEVEKIREAHACTIREVLDMLLLENQLPYELLKLLANSSEVIKSMDLFCGALSPMPKLTIRTNGGQSPEQSNNVGGPHAQHTIPIEDAEDDPVHLLDRMRKLNLGSRPRNRRKSRNNDPKSGGCMDALKTRCDACLFGKKPTSFEPIRNLQNLKEAGILQVKRDDDATLSDIFFHPGPFAGYLHLPPLLIGSQTETVFNNLKAYELCPDFDNEFDICSYIAFISLLLNCEADVKELRSAGVLVSQTLTDKEVVELFTDMSSDLITMTPFFWHLVFEMEAYFKSKCRTWVAEAYYTYFKSPWSIIACTAAGIGLLLTLFQTIQAFNSLQG